MLLVINMTGLDRTYWTPEFERRSDGDGLWYATAKWLCVEVTIHSREMGAEVVRRFNASIAKPLEPDAAGKGER
ncbi:MAG: hypothetical protein P4L67_04290 [Candidatus Pacebacteria bacterium]|nr:hypothetical protein [Candidatus Paceibacterota bacterium]